MINKENFVKYIHKIENLHHIEENINKATNGLDWFISFAEHEQLMIDILEDVFDDKNEWISYFIYELDFGKKWRNGTITFNGEDIPMSTARGLYDVLVKNMEYSR